MHAGPLQCSLHRPLPRASEVVDGLCCIAAWTGTRRSARLGVPTASTAADGRILVVGRRIRQETEERLGWIPISIFGRHTRILFIKREDIGSRWNREGGDPRSWLVDAREVVLDCRWPSEPLDLRFAPFFRLYSFHNRCPRPITCLKNARSSSPSLSLAPRRHRSYNSSPSATLVSSTARPPIRPSPFSPLTHTDLLIRYVLL